MKQFAANKWVQRARLEPFSGATDGSLGYLRQRVAPESQSEILFLVQPVADATHSISPAVQLGRFNLTLILWQMGDNLEIHNMTHTLKQNGLGGWANSDVLVTPIIPHSQVFHQFDTWFKTRALITMQMVTVFLSGLHSCSMKLHMIRRTTGDFSGFPCVFT